LIRRVLTTPANVNDTVPADALVCGDEAALYADKGYAKQARRAWLRSLGIKPRIMHKSWGGGPPLTRWQRRHNALIAPVRAEVEGVFATLKRWMGFGRVRYRGLPKNASHASLLALAYNMTRSLKLA
jgi:IS5 family transposase